MDAFIAGFALIASVEIWLTILLGVVVGVTLGTVPGISTSMGIALMLPITFQMPLYQAIGMILGLYVGGTSGALVTAILINIPGNSSAIATIWDGHPMARNGDAGRALGIGILSSFVGGIFSLTILFMLAPRLARIALGFGGVEYFAIIVFSLTIVASVSGKSLSKGIISATLGVIMTTVGMAPIDAVRRFTFGFRQLDAGFQLLPVLVGIYAVAEILRVAEKDKPLPEILSFKLRGFGMTLREFKGQIVNYIRSCTIGTFIGILPALGTGIASIMAYSVARNQSKTPEKFGTGHIEGIVAPESANSAVTGSAIIPVLTLGIPGDAGTALLLAALMIHGITPGPLMFTTNIAIFNAHLAALLLSNIFLIVVMYFGMRFFLRVLKVPTRILFPVVLVMCIVGAFSTNNRIFDVYSIIGIAVLGYALTKFKYPTAPFVMGFILGDLFELYLRRGLMVTDGSFLAFFTRPIAAVIFIISFVFLAFTLYGRHKYKDKGFLEGV